MPLRRRISLVAAATVAVAVAIACSSRTSPCADQLLGQIDNELPQQAQTLQTDPVHSLSALPTIPASAGGPAPYEQIVRPTGRSTTRSCPTARRSTSAGSSSREWPWQPRSPLSAPPAFMTNVDRRRDALRMYTFQMTGFSVGGQIGRSPACAPARGRRERAAHSALDACRSCFLLASRSPRCSARMATRRVLRRSPR